jgi:hypothetical protein
MRTIALLGLAYVTLIAYALGAAMRVLGMAFLAVISDIIEVVMFLWTEWPYRVPVRLAAYLWLAWAVLTAG